MPLATVLCDCVQLTDSQTRDTFRVHNAVNCVATSLVSRYSCTSSRLLALHCVKITWRTDLIHRKLIQALATLPKAALTELTVSQKVVNSQLRLARALLQLIQAL